VLVSYANWKDRKLLAAAIKPIYIAPRAEAALAKLDAFEQRPWGRDGRDLRRRDHARRGGR